MQVTLIWPWDIPQQEYLPIASKACDPSDVSKCTLSAQVVCTLCVTIYMRVWKICQCPPKAQQLYETFHEPGSSDKVTSIALMHIHYDRNIILEEAVDSFAKMHPRTLEFQCILKAWTPFCVDNTNGFWGLELSFLDFACLISETWELFLHLYHWLLEPWICIDTIQYNMLRVRPIKVNMQY